MISTNSTLLFVHHPMYKYCRYMLHQQSIKVSILVMDEIMRFPNVRVIDSNENVLV